VRASGAYAQEKLVYVAKYQDIFAHGMKNRWPERTYLDLMAGPGRCVDRDSGEEFEGSPMRSLAVPFTRRIFVEGDAVLCDALRRRVGDGPIVIAGDCNAAPVLARVRHEMPGGLGLAFIDNLGLNVPLATLETLTADRNIDLMITFQVSDLTRNVSNVLEERADPGRFTAFFGSSDWIRVAMLARERNASASEVATELLEFYATRLNSFGYAHVAHSLRLMKNSRNVPQYRLLLAGKHEKAVEFFAKIQKIDPSGQRNLL
jgi:three-Cys-motif partner protein